MARILECKKCEENEMEYAKTGASIDGRYYCQVCYGEIMEKEENELIKNFKIERR